MSFPKYDEYKESGIEWLGDIPLGWSTTPIKFVAMNGEKTFTDGDWIETPFITNEGVRLIQCGNIGTGCYEEQGYRYVSEETFNELNCTEIAPNDVLICRLQSSRTIFAGRACLAPDLGLKMITSVDNCILKPSTEFDPRYIVYQLSTVEYLTFIKLIARGGTRDRISRSMLAGISISTPPIHEQTAISNFLDAETAKIDALVAEQRRLIELLKEKRQAVISHAVTKGLNPNAPMKDSGIEWLGDVPEHWELKRLGWICTDINDINHEMPKAVENGVLFLSAKDLLDDGTLNFETDVKMISEEDYERLSQKIRPRRGDIIYSRIGAALGKARLVETDTRFNVSYSCCVIRIKEDIACRRFIRILLDGEMILTEARMRTKGIGVPDLGLGEIARFPIPLPPLPEQEEIVSILEYETGILNNLLVEAEKTIELLKERRTALISAAVTGKIDVREYAAQVTA